MNAIENMEYAAELFFRTHKVPVHVFDREGNPKRETFSADLLNPAHPLPAPLLNEWFAETKIYRFPVLKQTTYLEKYFSINVFAGDGPEEQFEGNLVVGPVLNFKMNAETIDSLFRDLRIAASKEDMERYYDRLPCFNNFDYVHMAVLLHFLLYRQPIGVIDILEKNERLEHRRIDPEQAVSQISKQRQNHEFHTDLAVEKKTFDCIRLGQSDAVRETYHAVAKQGKLGVLSKNSFLRSQKNLGIVMVSLATRAAVEGGLFQEIAYTLSDLYIQELEELNDFQSIVSFIEQVLVDFAKRVENAKKYRFSKPINQCLNYIFANSYEDISLGDLARLTSLNPSYLSALFKKEVGVSVGQYIHQTKVDEAKNLLNYTDHTMKEISSLLNFHDQSHFIKVFKKIEGVTPKKFRSGLAETSGINP